MLILDSIELIHNILNSNIPYVYLLLHMKEPYFFCAMGLFHFASKIHNDTLGQN
jgi:predicted membrane chloride channel (bestrophin family)